MLYMLLYILIYMLIVKYAFVMVRICLMLIHPQPFSTSNVAMMVVVVVVCSDVMMYCICTVYCDPCPPGPPAPVVWRWSALERPPLGRPSLLTPLASTISSSQKVRVRWLLDGYFYSHFILIYFMNSGILKFLFFKLRFKLVNEFSGNVNSAHSRLGFSSRKYFCSSSRVCVCVCVTLQLNLSPKIFNYLTSDDDL